MLYFHGSDQHFYCNTDLRQGQRGVRAGTSLCVEKQLIYVVHGGRNTRGFVKSVKSACVKVAQKGILLQKKAIQEVQEQSLAKASFILDEPESPAGGTS